MGIRNFFRTMKRRLCRCKDRVDSCDDLSGAENAAKRTKQSYDLSSADNAKTKKMKHGYPTRSKTEEKQLEPFIMVELHEPCTSKTTQHDIRPRHSHEYDRRSRTTPYENEERTRSTAGDRKMDEQRRTIKKIDPEITHADINMPTESQRKATPSYDTRNVKGTVKSEEATVEDKDTAINHLNMEIETLKQSNSTKVRNKASEQNETDDEKFKLEIEQLRKENERLRTKQESQTNTDNSIKNLEVRGITKPHTETNIGKMKPLGTETELCNFAEYNGSYLKRDSNEASNNILDDYKSEIAKLKEMNDNMKRKQKIETRDVKNELERLKRNINEKEAEIHQLNEENTKLKSGIDILEDNETEIIKQLKYENSNLKTKQSVETGELKIEIERMKGNIEGKETEITILKGEKDQAEEQIIREVDELKAEIETLKHKLEDTKAEQTKLKEENDSLNTKQASEINELKNQLETLKEQLEDKETEIIDLKSRNEDLASKHDEVKVAKVQIYCPGKIELSTQATRLFSERLQAELDDSNVEFLFCHDATDISSSFPTVCMCVTVSRLGTDVVNAVQNIELNSDVVLVILHHKAAHSFPAAASRQVLVDKRYQSLAGMFDLVFEKNELHECNMNETNMAAITDCLKKIMQRCNQHGAL